MAEPQPFFIDGLSQITECLFIGNSTASNNKLMLSNSCITAIISVSMEVSNTYYENIQYLKVPVANSPRGCLYDFFDPIADYIHSVEMKQGRILLHCTDGVSRSTTLCLAFLMKYHRMSLLEAYTWTKLCRPAIRPDNSFWEQLVQYEFKLFKKNTVNMVNSPSGKIPDIYKEKVYACYEPSGSSPDICYG
ncbi:PREDICTED: dual specificity protein phosphatase 21 [Hipposideros armiger]|uniref:Dual specificity protein phosphatase 21 n=1 Tax=Hipposideros armiger TaxID=186990 RepID=A0A8B7RTG0_HIPAR|nr:PREDICTED: dual specificity protein phosphatase 21 [Hipposideros armiger]